MKSRDKYGYERIRELNVLTGRVIVINVMHIQHCNPWKAADISYWKDIGEGLPPGKYYHLRDREETLLVDMKKYAYTMNNVWGGSNGNK
ncbi:MAG: hypothetical protein ACM3QV_00100 [Caulobacteraceae bacterium]